MATKSHERTYAVLFDMLEKKFTHYTRFEWECQVNEWTSILKTNGYDGWRDSHATKDIVELMSEGEWFVTFIED
jgi:hypothetical protein